MTKSKGILKRFTPQEEQWLKINYPDLSNEVIAKKLNRSTSSIEQKASKMKLKKSEAYLEKLKMIFVENMNETRFKKGNVPHNKGKKMNPKVREKIKHTFFKKGNTPHNHKPIGSERLTKDGYIMIKTEEPNVFKLKHRVIYEAHFGPIPENYILKFKDGNQKNCDINNLQLCSMEENMLQNSIQRFPEELIGVIRLKQKLNNKLKKYGKK